MRKKSVLQGFCTPGQGLIKGLMPAICLATLVAPIQAPAAEAEGLVYQADIRGPAPIPASERGLQAVVAKPWLRVSDEGPVLEGAIFDTAGDLLFCDVSGRRVLRATAEKQLSTLVTLDGLSPGGLALHADGRVFIAALNVPAHKGAIFAVKADGSGLETVIAPEAGYMPNDLVFDAQGGFYFSDFKGTSTRPDGGIYYVSADGASIEPVLPNLAKANGVTLSPDGGTLWATELSGGRLHRVQLADATTIAPIGSAIPYHFIGWKPDSMRADADGNVYVAISGQGRILAFNPNGIPIGQILLPGRDEGHNLKSTSLAISPGSNDLYSVSSDEDGGEGANIFHAKVFANGLPAVK
ncbi:lactonase [Marinobacterium mangrovicola]|uniref:Lactonase n=1 Tax=Marinobacterium mangrovicola TaxID=1476959 RepID=A0A4R1G8P8_9GAMM|nr:lactonase [Marinobacterium mangrovicola]